MALAQQRKPSLRFSFSQAHSLPFPGILPVPQAVWALLAEMDSTLHHVLWEKAWAWVGKNFPEEREGTGGS